MLSEDDRDAIDGLFRRLAEAERRGGPRDREAEDLIRTHMSRQPASPYYLAQTLVVQQQALNAAERRIAELEARGAAPAERRGGPWGNAGGYGQPAPAPRQGGFLAGAAETALGVAGGMMLANLVGSLFSPGEAHAAEDAGAADNGQDDGGQADDFGDDGGFDGDGFDVGGDF